MENSNTNTMTNSELQNSWATKVAISEEMCSTSTDQFRIDIAKATQGLSKKKTEKYYDARSTEFFDKYQFDAEPSETVNVLTEVTQLAIYHELSTFLAQKEHFMKYMGCHPARVFTDEKPSSLLKEFGEWLISAAEHSEYDYMDAEDLK